MFIFCFFGAEYCSFSLPLSLMASPLSAFTCWLRSLGININNLFEDLKDGLKLLSALDILRPGIVEWKRVNKNPKSTFQKGENCNYVIELGNKLKFSLVGKYGSSSCVFAYSSRLTLAGIGGTDILEGKQNFVLR